LAPQLLLKGLLLKGANVFGCKSRMIGGNRAVNQSNRDVANARDDLHQHGKTYQGQRIGVRRLSL
jgi:hypothetical protein